ncbi:hypothetical protein NBH00_23460 [Paraconexibacter antarcticus]|uniref:DUF7064 domain-containing protein n=1 Tax=Paraconexibacter antarcticus TaxID=2949664 RepID=A0ABY5DS60_9ACTN|nr:hypothetical protein [Paraconexibacter antarcticus]UTI64285.1 hypothetical protein NBH00_23460 [Paraconexibacter antarcticus]
MIKAEDFEFHERDPETWDWTETVVLIFAVPEANIMGNAYILARPNLGVVSSSVIVFQGWCEHPFEIDFLDSRMHLPCPESFLDQELANGLRFRAIDSPREFQVTYEDTHGACSFDLNFRALHEPYDTHDPAHNPLIAAGETDTGLGDAWANGHLDAIGHITGELELRGERYSVDCYDAIERSWGPREEYGGKAVSWVHIPFGERFGAHVAVTMKMEDGVIVYDELRFGYVHENGEMFGVTECRMEAERVDMIPVSTRIWLKDTRGKEYEFFGTAAAGSPWYQFIPAYVCYHTLMRYQHPEYGVAHAEMGDIFGMDWLGDRYSRHARLGAGAKEAQ